MAGRKPKYTEDRITRIIAAITLGASYELASKYAGISYDTLIRWRQQKAEFAVLMDEAEGRAAFGWLEKIEAEANNGDWRAASWKLERRYPQDYGKTVQEQQHTGKDGAPIRVIVDHESGIGSANSPAQPIPHAPVELTS